MKDDKVDLADPLGQVMVIDGSADAANAFEAWWKNRGNSTQKIEAVEAWGAAMNWLRPLLPDKE
jgi:hypothetical protein